MPKTFYRIMLLVLCAAVMASCNLFEIDQEMDDAEPVAKIGDAAIVTKLEAKTAFNNQLNYYASWGLIDVSDAAAVKEFKSEVLDLLIGEKIREIKAAEYGADALTDDEIAEIEQKSQQEYDEYFNEMYAENSKENLTDDENTALVEELMAENGMTIQAFTEMHTTEKIYENLKKDMTKDVTISDEELTVDYEDLLQAQQEEYMITPESAESRLQSGMSASNAVVYFPEGYRRVKHVLIMLPDAAQESLSAVQIEIDDITSELNDAEDALNAAKDAAKLVQPEQTDEEIQTGNENIEFLQSNYDELAALLDEKNAAYDEQRANALTLIKPFASQIYALATSGSDFNQLIEEYGQDPGMEIEAFKASGYYIFKDGMNFDLDFRDAVFELEQVGDISMPVLTENGYHIIKLEEIVPEGEIGFDEYKAFAYEEKLEEKKDEYYTELESEWLDSYNIKKYLNRF